MAILHGERSGRRIDSAHENGDAKLTEMCDGCRELTSRVDRLEAALAARENSNDGGLTTTVCYWACVAPHGFAAFMMLGSEVLVPFGLIVSLASLPTLAVVQVFSARPLHQRLLRNFLAASVVALCGIAGLWIADVATPGEVIPFMLLLSPPAFFSGWFVAKVIAWNRGWLIVAPGQSVDRPRLHVRHLLLCTSLVAVYLAAARLVLSDSTIWMGSDVLTVALIIALTTMGCTVVASLMARILLAHSRTSLVLKLTALIVAATIGTSGIVMLIVLFLSQFTLDWEILFTSAIYSLPMTAWVIASTGWTFTMMRIADYRIYSPRETAPGN